MQGLFQKKPFLLFGLFPVVLIGLGLAGFLFFRGEDKDRRSFQARLEEESPVLRERGYFVSRNTTVIRMGMHGQITEAAETGQKIQPGDVVIRVDDAETSEELSGLNLEMEKMEIDIAVQDYHLERAEKEEDAGIALNLQRLEHARLQLEEQSQALTDEESRLLDIDEALARLDLEDARQEAQYQRKLLGKGYISESMLEPYTRRVETAETYLQELALKRELEEKGIPAEEKVELETNVKRLEAQVARGQRAKARRLEEIRLYRQILEARMAERQARVDQTQKELESAVLRSPVAGIAKRRETVDWRSGGRWIEIGPGVEKWNYDAVMNIIDPSRMQVRLNIHEADRHLLEKGLPVRVRAPAFPGRVFEGELTELGGVARDRMELARKGLENSRTNVGMFNAVVEVRDSDTRFHPGMSAMVEFILEPSRPRVVLPADAVYAEDGAFYVYKKGAMGFQKSAVEGEWLTPVLFAVDKGVAEGERVWSAPEEDEDAR